MCNHDVPTNRDQCRKKSRVTPHRPNMLTNAVFETSPVPKGVQVTFVTHVLWSRLLDDGLVSNEAGSGLIVCRASWVPSAYIMFQVSTISQNDLVKLWLAALYIGRHGLYTWKTKRKTTHSHDRVIIVEYVRTLEPLTPRAYQERLAHSSF
jgi:hypothetical protein